MEARPMDEVLQKVAAICPAAVQGDKIDFERLKQELEPSLDDSAESYNFTWVGKRDAIIGATLPVRKTLRPCKEESKNWDTTKNLYIEGDNLEVLKLLQSAYLNKIKMIYIDSPYNTGNDFVYCDDFADSCEEYLEKKGQCDLESHERLFKNDESNGRFHSNWCTMIYPRLKVARDLLADDGVIFMSIDDHEVANLRKICDEVFGEDNFVGQIVWQTTQKNDPKYIAVNHEYILCFVKNIVSTTLAPKWRTKHPLVDDMLREYNNIKRRTKDIAEIQKQWDIVIKKDCYKDLKHYKFVDQRGPYFAADISDPQRSGPKHDFVIHPITKQVCKAPAGGYSPREAEMRRRLENDEIHFGPTHEYVVCSKKYLETAEDRLNSVYYEDGRRATKLLESLVGKGVFEHPKSELLIKRLAGFVSNKDSIILDFFAGSSTTAHAVMQLNAEDGGHRKFIMVQLPELCDEKSEAFKAGYKNICEIGKERIRRAGDKIVSETGRKDLDIGFKVLKLADSNMEDVYYNPAETTQANLLAKVDNIKEGRTELDLLYGVMLDLGLTLDLDVAEVKSGKTTYYNVDNGSLVACFADNIPESIIKEIANLKPFRVVFKDSSFADAPSKINVTEIFKTLSPNTKITVL